MFENYGDLLTVPELQEALGIGRNTAYNLLKNKKIKSVRVGKLWKVPRKAVEEYIVRESHIG